eukprot:14425-Heterococcus_DN1.PRE.1
MPTKSNLRLTLQSFGAVEPPVAGSVATGIVLAGAVVAGVGVLVAVIVVLAAVCLRVAAGAGVGGAVVGLVVLAGLPLTLLPFFCSLRETPASQSAAACSAKGQPARAWQATRLSTKVTAQAFMMLWVQEE